MEDEGMNRVVYKVRYKGRKLFSRWTSFFAVEDGFIPPDICPEGIRFFTLTTGKRVEISTRDTIFEFSSERSALLSKESEGKVLQ